jgi:hypothetical protein
MRDREKIMPRKSLLQEKELFENLKAKKITRDSKKRKFTPTKGAIIMSRKERICITGISRQEFPFLKYWAALFIIRHLLF